MSYTPDPKSNIGQLYAIIPANKALTSTELYKILLNINPDFPKQSVATHLRFLEQKGLVFRQRFEGASYWSRKKIKQKEIELEERKPEPKTVISVDTNEKNMTLGGKVLVFCKQHIGKRISSRDVQIYVKADNTGYLDILKRLKDANALQTIPHTKPQEYLVLPDIKALDKVPTKRDLGIEKSHSVIQKSSANIQKHEIMPEDIKLNIANMSLSDILSEYVVLKQENTRLKEALQRMGMEFLQLGILEEGD